MRKKLKEIDRPEPRKTSERELRRSAHTVVRVLRWKWLPWFGEDVVLLDVNRGGLKFRAPQRLDVREGELYWVRILVDLSAGEETNERHLTCRFRCVWVKEDIAAFGGEFVGLSDEEQQNLDEWLGALRRRGKLAH